MDIVLLLAHTESHTLNEQAGDQPGKGRQKEPGFVENGTRGKKKAPPQCLPWALPPPLCTPSLGRESDPAEWCTANSTEGGSDKLQLLGVGRKGLLTHREGPERRARRGRPLVRRAS